MNKLQRWMFSPDDGVYYPIPASVVLHDTPGSGVFQLYKNPSPTDGRLGLKKICDKFEFNFKVYDLGYNEFLNKLVTVWNNDIFVETERNLGVIFNGIKGTSKTISAKLLCNKLDMPTVIINEYFDGILSFINSLDFECVILIDEAEKIFKNSGDNSTDEILLKLVDGVYNVCRKFYILTTNTLNVNDNLLGRPGRIRYIKEFGNLSEKVINEYLDDNLVVQDQRKNVLKTVDLLQISTIDILKNIVEEVNMLGTISENSCLNIPKSKFAFKILKFGAVELLGNFEEVKRYIKELYNTFGNGESKLSWLKKECYFKDLYCILLKYNFTPRCKYSNEELEKAATRKCSIEEFLDEILSGYLATITSSFSSLFKGETTNQGEVVSEPDEDGWFEVEEPDYYSARITYYCLMLEKGKDHSLYKGLLL